jgi:hypothetical protein
MNVWEKRFYITLFFLVIAFVMWDISEKLSKKDTVIEDKSDSIITKIEYKEKEVIKWKEQKESIKYITKFDTLVTVKIVYKELMKCDSVVKIDSAIIAGQDTIIGDQKELIALSEAEKERLKKEVKREKRKVLITKIGSGIIIGAVLLLK